MLPRIAYFLMIAAAITLFPPAGFLRAETAQAERQSLKRVSQIIATKVQAGWKRPNHAPTMALRIHIKLNRDGSLDGRPSVLNRSDDPAFRAYAHTALRAIQRAAPFNPAAYGDSYDQWKSVILPLLIEPI